MPLVETPEQTSVRLAAAVLTQLRSDAAEREQREVTISIETLRMLEAQMWTAYAEMAAK